MRSPGFPSDLLDTEDLLAHRVEVGDGDDQPRLSKTASSGAVVGVVIPGYGMVEIPNEHVLEVVKHQAHGWAVLIRPEMGGGDDAFVVHWAQVDLERGRPGNEALDDILGKVFPVLDQGFVRVVDYMGVDASIVQAARVSYGSGTKRVHEDEGLIRYCMRHRHTTPFEMCEIKLHVKVPMDCWRQWIRHRTANVNEYSTRYSEAIDAAQKTDQDHWRLQSGTNRQGSSGFLTEWPSATDGAILGDSNLIPPGAYLSRREQRLHQEARSVYEERLSFGVAREQARKDLPLSTYTEAYWKCDLHNLLHFLSLRMDSHAQEEIRAYATVIGEEIVARWVPMTWAAFKDYRLNAMALSARDVRMMSFIGGGLIEDALAVAIEYRWLPGDVALQINAGKAPTLPPNRERQEFEAKIHQLGWLAPWEAR